MKQRNPKARRALALAGTGGLTKAEALAFLDLAWSPGFPPFVPSWLDVGEGEAREAAIENVLAAPDFLRLTESQRAEALVILSAARYMAWKLDLEAQGIARSRADLTGQRKAPGFRRALKAFGAVAAIFGEAPFPFFGARGNVGLGPHAAMTEAAHEFLDATLKSFPAIGLEFPEMTRTRTRNFSKAPRAPYQRNLKRDLRRFGLARETVSRLLYAVRLVSKLSEGLRDV